MPDKRNRGRRPANTGATVGASAATYDVGANADKQTPLFCFRHIVPGYDVAALDTAGRAAIAMTMQERASLTWLQIKQAPRHGAGTELIPADQIKAPIPEKFQDQKRFTVFRYNGLLPMVGVRLGATFHVLWIEAHFGQVYDHG